MKIIKLIKHLITRHIPLNKEILTKIVSIKSNPISIISGLVKIQYQRTPVL